MPEIVPEALATTPLLPMPMAGANYHRLHVRKFLAELRRNFAWRAVI